MSTKLQAMLRVSVEGLEETQVPADLPTAQEDAEAVAEVQQAEQAVENADQQLETLEQVSQSLEALAVALEANPDGLDSASARMLHITVEGQLARVGEDIKVLPALECFQPQSTQLATTLSMEGLRETLMALAKRIREMLLKLSKFIGHYVRQVMGALSQAKRTAEDLAQRAKSLQGAGVPQIELAEYLANELRIGGRIPPGLAGLKLTIGVLEDIDSFALGVAEQVKNSDKVLVRLTTVRNSEDLLHAVADMRGFQYPVPRAFRHELEDNVVATDNFSGNMRYEMTRPTNVSTDADTAVGIMSQFNRNNSKPMWEHQDITDRFDRPVKVTALSQADVMEIRRVLPIVEEVCKRYYDESYQDHGDIDNYMKALTHCDYLIAGKHISSDEASQLQTFIMGLAKLQKNHAMLAHRVASRAVTVTRAYLQWAKQSVEAMEAAQAK